MNNKGILLSSIIVVFLVFAMMFAIFINISGNATKTAYITSATNNLTFCFEDNLSLDICSPDEFRNLVSIRNGTDVLPSSNYTLDEEFICLDEVAFNNTELDFFITCYGDLNDPRKSGYNIILGIIVTIMIIGFVIYQYKELFGSNSGV